MWRIHIEESTVGLMLEQRRRRWPSIKPTVSQRIVFAVDGPTFQHSGSAVNIVRGLFTERVYFRAVGGPTFRRSGSAVDPPVTGSGSTSRHVEEEEERTCVPGSPYLYGSPQTGHRDPVRSSGPRGTICIISRQSAVSDISIFHGGTVVTRLDVPSLD